MGPEARRDSKADQEVALIRHPLISRRQHRYARSGFAFYCAAKSGKKSSPDRVWVGRGRADMGCANEGSKSDGKASGNAKVCARVHACVREHARSSECALACT